jgi:hypothetical protein
MTGDGVLKNNTHLVGLLRKLSASLLVARTLAYQPDSGRNELPMTADEELSIVKDPGPAFIRHAKGKQAMVGSCTDASSVLGVN